MAIHSISGSSGAPVFVRPFPTEKMPVTHSFLRDEYLQHERTNMTVYSSSGVIPTTQTVWGGPWLLGVEWGYRSSHKQEDNNTGISGVVPAWAIRDLLNTAKLRAQREMEQRRLVESHRQGGSLLTES